MHRGEIKLYKVGACSHLESMLFRTGAWKKVAIPAIVGLVQYPHENMLIDTGYGRAFFEATKQFPEKLYALSTPVVLEKSLKEQLGRQQIEYIFISHFHADHIGGLCDFNRAHFICSRQGYEAISSSLSSSFTKLKKALLPTLLPFDFAQRVTFIEDLPRVKLPETLHPFTQGFLLLDKYFVIELAGHAIGHYGIVVGDTFFIADAIWDMQTLMHNHLPHPLTNIIMEDVVAYRQTLKDLQSLHVRNPMMRFIATHDRSIDVSKA